MKETLGVVLQYAPVLAGAGCAWIGIAVLGSDRRDRDILGKRWSLSDQDLSVLFHQVGVAKTWSSGVMAAAAVFAGVLYAFTAFFPAQSAQWIGAVVVPMLLAAICLGFELAFRPRAYMTRKVLGALEPADFEDRPSATTLAERVQERVAAAKRGEVLAVRFNGLFLVVICLVSLVMTLVPMLRLSSLLTPYLK